MNKTKNIPIKSYRDLVTTHEQTRAGFIEFALEKNDRSSPFIEQAKTFKILASKAKRAEDLIKISNIRNALLTAAGLSDKAVQYFTEEDKDKAINKLIEKYLKRAGKDFVDEAVYRFLLIKGDSLGGQMRNLAGALAQQKVVRGLITSFALMGKEFSWYNGKEWKAGDYEIKIEHEIKALHWKNNNKSRVLAFNLNITTVGNNVDICLFDADITKFNNKKIAKDCNDCAIMFAELKGGIDPAGADEHWKTGNTALERIRTAFKNVNRADIQTAFIAAAIADKMAQEIFQQWENGTLSYAANLTVDEHLVSFCDWTVNL